jgi:hypothetical protein
MAVSVDLAAAAASVTLVEAEDRWSLCAQQCVPTEALRMQGPAQV